LAKEKTHSISKSQFLKGIQCSKALWFYRNRPDLKPETDDAQQALFDQGNEIGQLAQTYFKGGVEVENEYWDIDGAIKKTEALIKSGKSVIYEATAKSPEGIYSKIDILKKVKGKNEWDLIEVKGSAGLKDYHIWDMASQRHAFVGAGYKIRKSMLMHVNSGYVRKGELDIKQLFTLQDCTNEVIEQQEDVKGVLPELLKVLNKPKEPSVDIGSHCNKPFSCDYKEHCWSHVPEYSVYNVTNGKKLDELLSMGILNAKDIPKDFSLGAKTALAVNSYRDNAVIVDVPALKEWIQKLEYPLYYLDYETASSAIPSFDGTSPYQQCPFQYSLHIQKAKGNKLQHLEFLHTEPSDPRESFIKSLIENCDKGGSVVAYNASFEKGVNNNLAKQFPKYRNKLMAINNRMVDLLNPFMSRALYHPKQMGSASIKAVLPSFVPDMSYDTLNVSDGQEASRLGDLILEGSLEGDTLKETIAALKEYCGQDTLAMVKLIEVIHFYLKTKVKKQDKLNKFIWKDGDFTITPDPDYDIDSSLTLSDKEKQEFKDRDKNKRK
jgi:CRISPR/Cas system-associated exonuclease Cas4 (RecB family)